MGFSRSRFNSAVLLLSLAVVSAPMSALPCTTLFLSGSADAVVAKNLDWYTGDGLVLINKPNTQKIAILIPAPGTPLTWISKHMSVTFTHQGRDFPSEGMNDAGLSVDIMELKASVYPPQTDPLPAVTVHQWVQYILDTSATVDEAIENSKRARITTAGAGSHYMVCDPSSRCAIFEYLNGQLTIHTNGELPYKALSNTIYDTVLDNLQNLLANETPSAVTSGTGAGSLDRFARAALLSTEYQPSSDAVQYAFSALDNVQQPTLTQWNIVFRLSSGSVSFRTRLVRRIRSVDLARFDRSCSSGVKMLDINADLQGDVTNSFTAYNSDANLQIVRNNILNPDEQNVVASYPELHTKCLDSRN
jgi:penicillin V acylase-like amidase (Ntn superfamily)